MVRLTVAGLKVGFPRTVNAFGITVTQAGGRVTAAQLEGAAFRGKVEMVGNDDTAATNGKELQMLSAMLV